MKNKLHLVKLCVGIDSVEHLLEWRKSHPSPRPDGSRRHVTRMWPKRGDEVLDGGSLYWVIKGVICARQQILRLDEVIGKDGIRRCGIVMDKEVIRTQTAPRRPFQGWRYLEGADAPADLPKSRAREDNIPVELATALAEIGVR